MPKKITKSTKKLKMSHVKQDREMRVTVYFGYGLFLLTIVGLVATLLPWFQFYSQSQVNKLYITMLLVSFVFTALAPPLVGYLAGDGATRSRSKLIHHYNGVLFGVLGVWLWLVATMLTAYTQQWFPISTEFEQLLLNLAPAVVAALITIGLGVHYARKTGHQTPLIDYTPYRSAIIASAAVLIVSVGVAAIASGDFGSSVAMTLLINLVTPALFMLSAGLAGYWIIGKAGGTAGERIVRSVIAVGFAVVGLTLFGQFVSFLMPMWNQNIVFYAIGFIVIIWLAYLLLLRRALGKK